LGKPLKKGECPACLGTLVALDNVKEFEEACRGFGIDARKEWYDETHNKTGDSSTV